MDVAAWVQAAVADAGRRGLPDLIPLLQQLARATEVLRAAPFESAGSAVPRTERSPDDTPAGRADGSGPSA